MSILENIHGHEDLVRLSDEERVLLCTEIREFLISHVAQTGGHLASNLGVVELAVAIETVFNTMEDRLVFDVGHQSYVHKLLTGRQADFARLRQFGGISGFPKPYESESDAFVAGHASSSVSIALGMARARTLLGQPYDVVALLGDGAATGGMLYEGLNDAAVSQEPMVIILNDNEMSIDQNVGGMSRHLSKLRTKGHYLGAKKKYRLILSKLPGGKWLYQKTSNLKDRVKRAILPTTIFDTIGITYLGPVDGHDLPGLIDLLRNAREMGVPVLVHVKTRKGLGYPPAEKDPAKFHGVGKFDPVSGQTLEEKSRSFSDSFGETMMELAARDNRVCAITAAMPGGTGLQEFKKKYPDRTFDVGIAEEHAVSMAGGLAKQGMVPVVALYSTFLQRSYDQIMQDIALAGQHVVLAVDRAGLVGEDGATHHGVFDVGFLRHMPGMRLLAPASLAEQEKMLTWAVEVYDGPIAIRYPRGGNRGYTECDWTPGATVASHRTGKDVTLITYGPVLENVLQAAGILASQGIEATVLRLTDLSDWDIDSISSRLSDSRHVVIVEETGASAGIGDALASQLHKACPGCRLATMDLGREFIPHGALNELYKQYGLDGTAIADFTKEVLGYESEKET